MHLSEQRSFEDAFELFESRKIEADQQLQEAERKLAEGSLPDTGNAAEELAALKKVHAEAENKLEHLRGAKERAEKWDDMTFLTGLEGILDEIGTRVNRLLQHEK